MAGVSKEMGVGVGVRVRLGVGVGVGVRVRLGVGVGVGVGVRLGVGLVVELQVGDSWYGLGLEMGLDSCKFGFGWTSYTVVPW